MGKVVHKKPQNSTEVVLRAGHRDLYGNWRLGVTVATRREKKQTAYCFTIICSTAFAEKMRVNA